MIGVYFDSDNPLDEFRKQNRQELIIKLNNKISNCSKCNNDFCHKHYQGNINAKVIIINDSATNDEDILKYYYDLLDMSDLNHNDIFQVFAVSCVTTRKDKDNFLMMRQLSNFRHLRMPMSVMFSRKSFLNSSLVGSVRKQQINSVISNTLAVLNNCNIVRMESSEQISLLRNILNILHPAVEA